MDTGAAPFHPKPAREALAAPAKTAPRWPPAPPLRRFDTMVRVVTRVPGFGAELALTFCLALGGDIATFWHLEQGVLRGQILDLGKQVLLLAPAFAGAQLAGYLILAASGARR